MEQDQLNNANGQSSTKQDHSNNDSNPDIITSNGDIIESVDDESNADIDIQPYENDMEYLKDGFEVVQEACKVYNFRETNSEEDRFTNTKRPVEALQREANAKLRKANNLFKRRLAKTTAVGGFLPRLELLAAKLKLVHFERMVIVTLGTLIIMFFLEYASLCVYHSIHSKTLISNFIFLLIPLHHPS